MLAIYRPQYIEKILTDAAGRRFRVIFAVSFVDGEARGRIVSAEEIRALSGDILKPYCLSASCSRSSAESEILSPYSPIATPFLFSLEFLINSQPTRAPSRI